LKPGSAKKGKSNENFEGGIRLRTKNGVPKECVITPKRGGGRARKKTRKTCQKKKKRRKDEKRGGFKRAPAEGKKNWFLSGKKADFIPKGQLSKKKGTVERRGEGKGNRKKQSAKKRAAPDTLPGQRRAKSSGTCKERLKGNERAFKEKGYCDQRLTSAQGKKRNWLRGNNKVAGGPRSSCRNEVKKKSKKADCPKKKRIREP